MTSPNRQTYSEGNHHCVLGLGLREECDNKEITQESFG